MASDSGKTPEIQKAKKNAGSGTRSEAPRFRERVPSRKKEAVPSAGVLDARVLSRKLFEETDPVRALQLALAFYERSPEGPRLSKIWKRAKDRVVVRLPRRKDAGRNNCLATLAFLRDAVQLATGTEVRAMEERCVSRGHAFCSHQFHWDDPAA